MATQQHVAKMLGISRARVGQYEERAMKKLRLALIDIGIEMGLATERAARELKRKGQERRA